MMSKADTAHRLAEDAAVIERALDDRLPQGVGDKTLCSAMRYAVLGGGKRIRGVLALEFCRLFCGTSEPAVPHAVAVELMHAASLVHDDMPEMDNDAMRRGKLSCHKQFGVHTALLTGDSLICLSLGVLAEPGVSGALRALSLLADAGGVGGIGSGQMMDIASETESIDYNGLLRLQRLKTGRLIRCAALLGAAAAGADEAQTALAAEYAERVGLAFQIEDDLLDRNGGSDTRRGLATFLTFLTPEAARAEARRLTDETIALLSGIPGSEFLCGLAEYLLEREN